MDSSCIRQYSGVLGLISQHRTVNTSRQVVGMSFTCRVFDVEGDLDDGQKCWDCALFKKTTIFFLQDAQPSTI